MKRFDKNMVRFVGKVVLITLLTVFVLRTFFFESYTISTSQMESALIKGDEVLVSKLSYGPRMPITPLSVPFAFNKLYSSLITLPYIRLFSAEIYRNDVVLFNSPLETDKPLDKRNLLLSRCIACPGDTIRIDDGIYFINNQQYVHSPTQIDEYFVLQSNFNKITSLCERLYLDMQNVKQANDTVVFTLNRYDAFVLHRNAADTFYRKNEDIAQGLVFICPSVGRQVSLTPNNIKIYKQIMMLEQGNRVAFEGDSVYIDGEKAEIYTFRDDYYWMLSDNTVDALDSRELGFIPFKNVIGRATIILYSWGEKGLRSDSFLTPIR